MTMIKTNESGRSMIEMLGVLAIIGVLSVGGIAGYSKAMNKFKTNKVADNVSMLVANIKTLYAQQNTYTGLNNVTAVDMGVVPDELVVKRASGATTQSLINAFNGPVFISASNGTNGTDGKAFIIEFTELSREACITLATNDWGSGYSSGLIAIAAKGNKADSHTTPTAKTSTLDAIYIGAEGSADDDGGQAIATPGGTVAVPLSVSKAAKACNCTTGNTCSVMWKYY